MSIRAAKRIPAWLAGTTVFLASAFASPLIGGAAAQSFGQPLGYVPQPAWSGASPDALLDAALEEDIAPEPDVGAGTVSPQLQRQVVNYATREPPGTVIIDTPNTALYYVLGGGRAIRYGVGVGREGFTWAGVKSISRKAEWPDWHPPAEMIARQPYLPRFMAGGPGNPLGARAMYLGGSIYRIHGTNDPTTIGKFVSSGCIRMTNEDAIDLYQRVNIGTKVVVLPMRGTPAVASRRAPPSAAVAQDAPRQHVSQQDLSGPELQAATFRNANAFVLY